MVHVQSSRSSVHAPWFVAGPGQTDALLILMAVFLVLIVFMFGVLMLRLHHLPEHIAQKEQKVLFQLVATLGLLAMFIHENLFWIAGATAGDGRSSRFLGTTWPHSELGRAYFQEQRIGSPSSRT